MAEKILVVVSSDPCNDCIYVDNFTTTPRGDGIPFLAQACDKHKK